MGDLLYGVCCVAVLLSLQIEKQHKACPPLRPPVDGHIPLLVQSRRLRAFQPLDCFNVAQLVSRRTLLQLGILKSRSVQATRITSLSTSESRDKMLVCNIFNVTSRLSCATPRSFAQTTR